MTTVAYFINLAYCRVPLNSRVIPRFVLQVRPAMALNALKMRIALASSKACIVAPRPFACGHLAGVLRTAPAPFASSAAFGQAALAVPSIALRAARFCVCSTSSQGA